MLTGKKVNELDLPFVKEYLKVDFEDDDVLIETIILAAQSYIQTILGYKWDEMLLELGELPDELTIACLLIIAHWYDNRQLQQMGTLGNEIAFAVSAIIDAHKNPFKEYEEIV